MKCRTLSYGNEGWNDKVRVAEGIIASRPRAPFIYNDVLVLVPSSRMKRTYGRLFLDVLHRLYGATALIQPDVLTFPQFLEKQYARLNGPRIIDETGRLILLEGLVKERLVNNPLFSQSPDLLAPSLSSAIANMIEQLAAAGVAPADLAAKIQGAEFFEKPQVSLLFDVYDQYRMVMKKRGLTDPAGMCERLAKEFNPAWLAPYREIIIDGIQDSGKLEREILRTIAACENVTYLLDVPALELPGQAGDLHPLRGTKDFISSLCIAPELYGTPANGDDRFLASALFSDMPFSEIVKSAPAPGSFQKTINLLSTVNPREEVSLIAGMVKTSLMNGTPPDSVLVAFPALDAYAPLAEEIFTDYGIPYNRALGRQLSTSPVTTSIITMLRACQDGFSGVSLLRILSSPFLKFADQPALAPVLDRLMRYQRIIGGKEKLLLALDHSTPEKSTPRTLRTSLQDIFIALEPFASQETAPLRVWMDRLMDLIAWSDLDARVERIHGPLNINLQALRKLTETCDALARSGALFPEYRYTFHEWFFLLKKTFMRTRFQVPPDDEGGVQILGLEESTGRPWQEIYLGGLMDGTFPQRLPQNIFLPEATLEVLGVRTLERARLNAAYYFYRILLSAEKVTLTWPENDGDRPVVPSPFLEELAPLQKAGLINRGIKSTSGIQFSLKVEESRSIPELAKAIGLATSAQDIRMILHTDLKGLSGIKAAIATVPEHTASVRVPQQKQVFRVTELDEYINCPYDYYVRHVLGIESLEEPTEDISPLARGSKVHAILRNFYLAWTVPVTRENRTEARTLLKKLADSSFDKEADTVRNRREKDLFLNVMAERFLDAEEEFWKQGMRPAYLEQQIDSFSIVLSNGEEAELSAKIDRIDVDRNGNFIIVDYKTGMYPQPKMGSEQDIFQLPVYSAMSLSALSGKGPALHEPIGLAYYDLAGKAGAGARDVVLYNKDALEAQPAAKPKASPKSAEEFEAILKQSLDKARKAIEGILAGEFRSTPQDENRCRYCTNEMMCEKDHDHRP